MATLIKVAFILTSIAALFLLIGLVTSSWLVVTTDAQLEKPKFENLGLWIICMRNYEDITRFSWHNDKQISCFWTFQKEQYVILYNFLLPTFYQAIQVSYFGSTMLMIFSAILSLSYYVSEKNLNNNALCYLSCIGGSLLASAVCGTISCGIFVFYGDSRYWMPHPEHNEMGYSFWCAFIGTILTYISGICFMIGSRRRYIRHNYL